MRLTTILATDPRARMRSAGRRNLAIAWISDAAGRLASWLGRDARRAERDRLRNSYRKVAVHYLREIGPTRPDSSPEAH